jgi:hypothetical protein
MPGIGKAALEMRETPPKERLMPALRARDDKAEAEETRSGAEDVDAETALAGAEARADSEGDAAASPTSDALLARFRLASEE